MQFLTVLYCTKVLANADINLDTFFCFYIKKYFKVLKVGYKILKGGVWGGGAKTLVVSVMWK